MIVYHSGNGDIWEDGEVIPADPATPAERDARLHVAISQVRRQMDGLDDWYRRRRDFAVMPGGAVLRQVAADAHRLAVELQARADEIDPPQPPVSETPHS